MSSQEQINKLTIRQASRIKERRHWIAGASVMAIAAGLLVTSVLNTQLNDKANTSVTPAHVTKSHAALIQNYAQLPLRFEQNQGQSANEVSFMSRGSGYTLFLTPTETVLTLQDKNNHDKEPAVVRTLFVDANIPAEFNGNSVLPGKVNYLIGRDKNSWLTNVPTYSDVIAKEIYSGIDLRYHGDQRQLEYDFIVSPEGNAADIKMHFTGVDLLSINEKGQLTIETSQGLLYHKKPIVYQDIDGERVFIEGNYVIADNDVHGCTSVADAGRQTGSFSVVRGQDVRNDCVGATDTVSFELGDYDKSHDLVIDPILVYSTYLGGDSDDRGLAITVDDDGNAYIAGTTISTTFPTINAYQPSLSGSRDTFIAKLNAAGDTLIYSTYFGGSGDEDADDDDDYEDEAGEDDEDDNDEGDSDSDTGKDIAVDQNGNLYITGSTNSNTDFPIVNAIQSNYGGGDRDAYIAKLSADGSNLLFSSYLGGSKKEKGFGIALDASNNVFITGRTNSNNFPVANAYQASLAGNSDAFISKLSEDGLTMHYSSYFGGSKSDVAKAIAVDDLGNAIIAGVTKSKTNLPLQNALQSSFGGGGRDAFVTQFNADGSALNYSTYLGGSKKDKARGIAVDSSGNAIVVGMTKSNNNFPLVGALQNSYGGGSDDGFISKLNASGNALIFSTYIGGSKTDKVNSVAVDSNDDIYVIGTTKSTSGIPIVDAVQQNLDGSKRDAFITKLNPNGDTVIYSTYLGGDKNDRGKDIAVNGQDAFITGITKSSADFPRNNAVQNSFGGGAMDAFIAKIGSGNQAPVITSTPITTGAENQAYTYTVVATDADNDDLEYSLTTSPVGMTIDTQTGTISWLADVVGDSTVEVKVDDGNGGTDAQSYTLTIVADNQAPSIISTVITEAFTHQLYSYDVDAIDPDNDTLAYSLQVFPTGMLIDGATGLITWTPVAIASVNVTVQADDGNNNTDSQSFIINVADITPPEVTPPADITIEATGATTIVSLGNATAVDQIDGALTPTADNTGPFTVGTHIVTWSATDASGNEGSATQTVTVTDTTAPVVTPPADITIEATGATTEATLGSATAIDLVDGALTPTADNTGPFAVGIHTVIWSVIDAAGNEGTATQTVTVTDTTPPEVTPPADITIEATGATTDVTLGAATANDLVDGALIPAADNTGPFAVGVHTVTWSVADTAGNEGTATQTVTITDTTAPVVTTPADITIEATGPTTDITLGTATANDLVDGALTPAADNTGPFAVGVHTITWSVTDAAGNEGTATQTVTVTDTTAPVVTPPADITVEATGLTTTVSLGTATATDSVDGVLTPIANNTGPFALGSNTVTWSVTDAAGNIGSATQSVIVRDTTPPLVIAPADITVESTGEFTTVVLGVATASDSVDGILTPLPDNVGPYPLGDTIITWSAIDSSVNTGFDTQTVTVVDSTSPIVTITSPNNGSYTNVSSQTVTGTLNEPANVTVNGQAATVNGLNFSFGPVTLAEGLNTFNVVATDPSNNAVLASTSVTLDSVAPVITLTSPEDNTLTNQTNVNFVGSVSEAVNTITIAGQTVTQSVDLSFNATATIAEGTQVIDIIATDLAGNNDTVSVTVTVDTTPPATPNTALINRSNPANGIVMVTGLVGSVEAGSLVHVVNPSNDFEAFEVVQSDGSFTAEVPAFANDSLTVFAVDAAGNSSVVSIIAPSTTPELNLNAIGDRVAPLGQITRFTVTATDSSGEQIELGVTPLPLPDNMEYNIVTGELSFQPTSDQAGDYELTFSAENVDERITETITVTVPAADPSDPTVFTGRVLDANSMEEGNIVPIVGATISFLDSGVVTTTDNQGYFTLNNLPLTAATFDIDGSTAQPGPGGVLYASFREGLPLVSNVTNLVERPFYMPRLGTESLTTIDPLQETTVTNPTLGIDLTVAPGTAINDSDGTPFTGQMTISEVPRDLAPANLPEFMDPALLITIQPVGVSYTVPAPITFDNTEGYAANSEVDIWSVDPDLGIFVIVGTGRVTADGSRIETIAGGIVANDWHATMPPDPDGEGNEDNPDPDHPCPACPEEDLTSTVSLNDGHMGTRFTLPAYRSLEASRALTFSYKTFRANPQPSIMFNSAINVRSTVPSAVSYELEVAGLEQGEEVFIDTSGFSENLTEAFSTAITFDAADFASGMYDYRLKVTSNFTSGTSRSRFVDGRIMVVNEQQSAFGAGWMLEGLYRLAFNAEDDDSVTMISPDGRSITYRESGVPGEYDEPDNDYATFAKNPDGTYTHTEKDGIKMHFDAEGFITSHVDRNGNTTSYAYDAEGKLDTITDPVGLITTFAYDNNGYLTTVTDPADRVSTFEYDPVGNLIQITYPDSTFQTFEYDERHLMTAHEDENENRFTNRYDAFGRVIDGTLPDGTVRAGVGRQSAALVDVNSGIGTEANPAPVVRPDAANGGYVDGRGNPSSKELDSHGRVKMEMDEVGRVTEHVRDTDSNPTQTTRPIGSVVSRTFDTFGNVLTQTEDFNSATTTYTYDTFSLVTSVKNPRNHTTTINRDPVNGNPLTIVNELGHTTTMTYDSHGLVETMTSPNGLVTTYTYNDEGLMETKIETPPVTSPGNVRLWSYSYYPTGLLQTVNTPDGITLTYTYDDRSMLTSVTDNLNQSIIYTYDDHKNVTRTETRSSDGSLALLVDNIYDNRNRLMHTKAPHVGAEESITQRILDPNSNLIGLIDPNGNASSNTYDEFNRLDTNTHRENGVTDYTYDDQDRITQVIAPNGVTTSYEYDIISRRTKEISPDRGTISYTYDLANNVSTITEGRGIVSTMTYDALERISTKVYPNTIIGKTENVSYSYDSCNFGLGYLCSRADESGSSSYNYDAYGNLIDHTFTEIEGTNYTTGYVYDNGDNRIQMTMPSGRIVDYTRDGVRRINAIDTTLNGSAQNIASNIQYRGDNQVTQRTFGNGTTDSRSYDLQGRLLTQQLEDSLNTIIDQRTYTYDKNSNVLSINTNEENNTYLYDRLDRITSDQINTDSPIDYSYDQNDNRLTKQAQDASIDELIDYVTNSNRILATDALRTAVTPPPVLPNRDMVYNDVGRLYQLIEESSLKAEYIYNDAGQRTRKTHYQSDGITIDSITVYHYDQMGYLISETDEQGNLIKDYIWQEGMTPVAQIDNNAGTESIVYLYTDHLMTNRLATDEAQTVVWRWEGEAFGNTPAEELAGTTINLRFPGQYYDEETSLHYNIARYYDPSIGRYITSDPIGLNGGINTYLYADSNPIILTDPLGLCPCKGGEWDVVPTLGDWTFSIAFGGYFSAGGATFKCKKDSSLTCTASIFCIGGGPIIGGGFTWNVAGSAYAADSSGLGGWSGWQITGGKGPVSGSASSSGGSPVSSNSNGQSASVSAGISVKGGAAGIKCYTAYLDCSCPCDE